jgi:uncharacterized protein YneF (UPF0154 family)
MFKILRKKIQSLSQTQQNIITVILILFNLAIIVFWINFWLGLKKVPPKIEAKPPVSEEKVPQEVIKKMTAPPSGKSEEVPEDILEKLSAPKKSK